MFHETNVSRCRQGLRKSGEGKGRKGELCPHRLYTIPDYFFSKVYECIGMPMFALCILSRNEARTFIGVDGPTLYAFLKACFYGLKSKATKIVGAFFDLPIFITELLVNGVLQGTTMEQARRKACIEI